MSVTIMQGDARALPLADASVDLIVTSPPFWGLRSYTDNGEHVEKQIGAEPRPADYVTSLVDCTAEWMRVLKPGGSIWVNLGDKYARPGGGRDLAGEVELWKQAMGIDWMVRDELSQAIPPAYTRHLGAQLLSHLSVGEVTA